MQLGFDSKFCSLIRERINNETCSIFINDSTNDFIYSNSGIRQGELLSPLLIHYYYGIPLFINGISTN